MGLPTDDKSRKSLPVFDGVLMYFPDAILAVAEVSRIGNDQHNPGQPLHWARGKSMDQMNTALRHLMDHGTGARKDVDGAWHLAKAAWRVLAELQLTIERERTSEGAVMAACTDKSESRPELRFIRSGPAEVGPPQVAFYYAGGSTPPPTVASGSLVPQPTFKWIDEEPHV